MHGEDEPSKIEDDSIVAYFTDWLYPWAFKSDVKQEVGEETTQLFKTAFESGSDIEALKQSVLSSSGRRNQIAIGRVLYVIASHLRDRRCIQMDEESGLSEQSPLEMKTDLAMLDFVQYMIDKNLVDNANADTFIDRLGFSWGDFTVSEWNDVHSLTKDYQKKMAGILGNLIHPKNIRLSGHGAARYPFEELFYMNCYTHQMYSQSFPALCILIKAYEKVDMGEVTRWYRRNITYDGNELLKHYKASLSVYIYRHLTKKGQLNYGYHDYQVEDWIDILELYSSADRLEIIKKVISKTEKNESHQLNLSLAYLELCVKDLKDIPVNHPLKKENTDFCRLLSQIIQDHESPGEKKRTLNEFARDLKTACERSDPRLKDAPIISRTVKLIVGLLICLTGIGAIVMASSSTCQATFFKGKEKSAEQIENLKAVSEEIGKKKQG